MRLKLDPVIDLSKENKAGNEQAILDGFIAIQQSGLINLPQTTKDWIRKAQEVRKIRSKKGQ